MSRILKLFKKHNSKKLELEMPYIIAEAGVNHEGSMDLAKRLIREAKEAGADAIKFQTYKADTLASKNSPSYWDVSKEPIKSQHELFKKYDKFWKDEFIELKRYSDEVEIEFMSTPFDVESAKFLNEMMSVFKISSSDITNKPFIEYLCDFGKPIILSTGASSLDEIKEAASWISNKGNPLALLHCVLNYPTLDSDANLGMILGLEKNFPNNLIGYSDHTLPKKMKSLEVATLLGAKILEKHFTHDKKLPGNDHYHAMDLNDLKKFKKNMEEILTISGEFEVKALEKEKSAIKNARRSLVALRNIAKGEKIKFEDLTWKRPAFGISPKDIDSVINKTAVRSIKTDEILYWELLS